MRGGGDEQSSSKKTFKFSKTYKNILHHLVLGKWKSRSNEISSHINKTEQNNKGNITKNKNNQYWF